jgi:hypothetical protein
MSRYRIKVFNPSPDDCRGGHIILPLKQVCERTGIAPGEIVLRQGEDAVLPYQIDNIDTADNDGPDDLSGKVLAFSLARPIPRAESDSSPSSTVITLERGVPEKMPLGARLDIVGTGVKFINDRLELWFNLNCNLNAGGYCCYSGSATSVQLNRKEILDVLFDPKFHDVEKRSMQLDYIRLYRQPWDLPSSPELPPYSCHYFAERNYRLESRSEGPVRATITISSEIFSYDYTDPVTREASWLDCKLYRIISLYAGADYLVEEVFVKGVPKGANTWKQYVHLYFIAHYFSYLRYLKMQVSHFERVPDWFAVSNLTRPFQSYGFATDRHAGSIKNPHLGFPDIDKESNSISWQLLPCRFAKCLHLFMHFEPNEDPRPGESRVDYEHRKTLEAQYELECRMGRAWYQEIYRPLWAELE